MLASLKNVLKDAISNQAKMVLLCVGKEPELTTPTGTINYVEDGPIESPDLMDLFRKLFPKGQDNIEKGKATSAQMEIVGVGEVQMIARPGEVPTLALFLPPHGKELFDKVWASDNRIKLADPPTKAPPRPAAPAETQSKVKVPPKAQRVGQPSPPPALPALIRRVLKHRTGLWVVGSPTMSGRLFGGAQIYMQLEVSSRLPLVAIGNAKQIETIGQFTSIEPHVVGGGFEFASLLDQLSDRGQQTVFLADRPVGCDIERIFDAATQHRVLLAATAPKSSDVLSSLVARVRNEEPIHGPRRLAACLRGVAIYRTIGESHRLMECLLTNAHVRQLVAGNHTELIDTYLQCSSVDGFRLNSSLAELVHQGQLSLERAQEMAEDRDDLLLQVASLGQARSARSRKAS